MIWWGGAVVGSKKDADDVGGGAAVPLPTEWPGLATEPGHVEVRVDVVEWVSRDLQAGVQGVTTQPGRLFQPLNQGQLRELEDQPGVWMTGRDVLHVHAQVRDRVETFYSVVTESLTEVARRLRSSAGAYREADQRSATGVEPAAHPVGAGGGASGGGSGPSGGSGWDGGQTGTVGPVGTF